MPTQSPQQRLRYDRSVNLTSRELTFALALASALCISGCKKDKSSSESGNESSKPAKPKGCAEGTAETKEVVDGETAVFCAKPDGTKHGPYKKTDDIGGETIVAYVDGKRDGLWQFLDEGEMMLTTEYSAACGEECETGMRTTYLDGKKAMAQGLVEGEQEGWSFAYDNGVLAKAACFEGGRQALVVDEPNAAKGMACPLTVEVPAHSGRVLAPYLHEDDEGGQSIAFAVGEVVKAEGSKTSIKDEAGEERLVRSAFVVPLSAPKKLKEGMQVLAHHPEQGALIGLVVDVAGDAVTVFRHKGLGMGMMNSEIEVALGDVRIIDGDLAPGSAVMTKNHSKPRMGTVFATHGGKVAAEIDGSLVVLGEKAYYALSVEPSFDDHEDVYIGPMLGIREGVVLDYDKDEKSVTVEYEFAGRTREEVFLASRVLAASRIQGEQ